MTEQAKNVLITGTSSGHGFATAKELASRGHRVFAGMREAETKNAEAAAQLEAFAADAPGEIHVLQMDVTKDEEVESAANRALEIGGHFDVAVNNAGYASIGWMEEFSVADFHEIMDVFVYGAQRVYRAVLPSMRARRSGLVVNVTTIGARLAMPLRQGPYTLAKWALEAMSERYHQELSQFQIDSITVQPGLFPGTKLGANVKYVNNAEIHEQYPPYQEDRYYKVFDRIRERMLQDSDQGEIVGRLIADLAAMPAGTRPIRSVAKSYNVIGCDQAERINRIFGELQEELLDIWVQGRPGDFFADED